jgi:hypothetical protein
MRSNTIVSFPALKITRFEEPVCPSPYPERSWAAALDRPIASSTRKLSRIAGVLVVITFITFTSIPAASSLRPRSQRHRLHHRCRRGHRRVGIGNGLMLGYLMFRSGSVPRRMAMLAAGALTAAVAAG